MKKVISNIMLVLFMLSISLFGINNNVHADVNKHRIYGNDRIQTSVKISLDGWEKGAKTAVIAQGYGYADALCAGPLAKKHNAPILLSTKDGLNSETVTELKRLKVEKVFLIGGTGSLSESIENELNNIGIKNVERLWGRDRYETSVKIAQSLGNVDSVVITSGNGYADSLSIAPIAAAKGMPILLSDKEDLSDSVKEYIKNLNIKSSYIVGGTGVISDKILNLIPNCKRLSGKDRFETNLNVLQHFEKDFNFDNIFITQGDGPTGSEFADALSTSAIASQKSSPVVLTYKTIYDKTAYFIKGKMTKNSKLIAIGGTSVVPNEIQDALIDLFNGKTPTAGIGVPGAAAAAAGGGVVLDPPKGDAFNLVITRDNGSKTIKTKTVNVEKNKNAMDYLKSVASVTELQGPGFINGIDGLVNVPLKSLSTDERKKGLLGKDWFIYLNGKLTDTGAPGVHPQKGDTLNFDYHEWDWHALMSPDYKGSIPLKLQDVPDKVSVGQDINLTVTCVYRPVYGVKVKVDGKEVATTDIDGAAKIKLDSSGKHIIKVEKDGGSAEKEVIVPGNGGPGPTPEEDFKFTSDYDGDKSGKEINKNAIICANNITVQNVKINGTLTVDPGKDGVINLKNVTANKIIIKSGADKSIHFDAVKSPSLVIDSNSNIRVEAKGETNIGGTEIRSNSILDVPTDSTVTFGQVTIAANSNNKLDNVELRGNFADKVNVKANVKLVANTEKPVQEIKVTGDSKVALTLEGKFNSVMVEKEALIILGSNSKVNTVDTDANVSIQAENKDAVGIIKKAENVNVECKDKDGHDLDIPKQDKKDVKLVEISGDLSLVIVQRENGTISIKSNSNNNQDYIAITLYDESGNISYVEQSSNGTLEYTTGLKPGKHHGFVKASSKDKIGINEFEVK